MAKAQLLKKLNCEQVYNVWASEPELLQILDIRSTDEYKQAHIPGAKNIRPEELPGALSSLGNKLAVIIANPTQEDPLMNDLQSFDNFVCMSNCHRWKELEHPMTGESIAINFEKLYDNNGVTMRNDIIFHQLFDATSSTYTYIIADKASKEAAIIDPVLENVDRDLQLIDDLGLRLMYALDTHIHADHITGAGEIRKRKNIKTGVSQEAEVTCVDIGLEEGQELLLGNKKIKVLATPGHTNTCLSYLFEGMVFTGDTLLIRGCGRTDFQQGSSEKLFHSVREKLFKLPSETIVFPGHDYKGFTASTIGDERKLNARLKETISLAEFQKTMSELKLANPKKIHEAVPANLSCGNTVPDKVPEISVEQLKSILDQGAKKPRLIDVRRPDEFNNELGHIKNAELVTLGPDLTALLEKGNKNEDIVFICRSGARSGNATMESLKHGYTSVNNMVGGMLRWNELQYPTEKN